MASLLPCSAFFFVHTPSKRIWDAPSLGFLPSMGRDLRQLSDEISRAQYYMSVSRGHVATDSVLEVTKKKRK